MVVVGSGENEVFALGSYFELTAKKTVDLMETYIQKVDQRIADLESCIVCLPELC